MFHFCKENRITLKEKNQCDFFSVRITHRHSTKFDPVSLSHRELADDLLASARKAQSSPPVCHQPLPLVDTEEDHNQNIELGHLLPSCTKSIT